MAFTVSRYPTVFGDKRAILMEITADAATQTIETGLQYVELAIVSPLSAATANFKCAHNSNASGVQSNGVVAITGVATGDKIHVLAIGR
jgi:hypothetical protein